MTIGEMISALALCASSFDDDKDHLLMLKSIYSIDVKDDQLLIYFSDGNTQNIKINKNGQVSTLS